MNGQALLPVLRAWSEAGWLRRVDAAFARFLLELCPQAAAPVVLSAVMAAHLEGRGHSCVPLDALLDDIGALTDWPAAAHGEWQALVSALPARLADWLQALQSSPLVWVDDPARNDPPAGGQTPLLLRGTRLYLRRYGCFEQRVAAQVVQRSSAPAVVNLELARHWLDGLFPPSDAPDTDWQKLACALALRGRLSIVTGGPGTGKTHTAASLLALLYAVDPAPERLRMALAAPTGKAAARLKQSIDAVLAGLQQRLGDALPWQGLATQIGPARTLHRLLGARPDTRQFRHDAAHPLPLDVLVVDEASMVHLEMMAALLDALPPRARVILLGDKDQLASVEAGAVLGELCRDAEQGGYGAATAEYALAVTRQPIPAACVSGGSPLAQQTVMLRRSRRFSGPIGELAAAVKRGDSTAALALLREPPGPALHWLEAPTPAAVVRLALAGRAGAEGGYDAYLQLLQGRPADGDSAAFEAWVQAVLDAFDRFRLLCALREGEWGAAGLNLAVEAALAGAGRLTRHGDWYEGRPVMVTRNDPGLGMFNGDIGIALRPMHPQAPLRAYFPGGDRVRSVAVSRLSGVETAYAMTVHKSQGSEFEHAVLVLPPQHGPVLTRELVYTGITRARQSFTLVTAGAQVFATALAQCTRRTSGLLERLTPAP